MPVTAPDFFNQSFAFPGNRNLAFYEWCQWLNNDHASVTGPGWGLIAADDTTRIDVAATFTALNSANDWSKGNANTPANGSWCCLQTLPGNTDRVWQMIVFFGQLGAAPEANSLRVTIFVIPYADGTGADPFVVPGATTAGSTPTVPALSMATRLYTDSAEWSGTILMTSCADESSVVYLPSIDGTDPIARKTYFIGGEMDGGPPNETRNFVYHIYEGPTAPGPHIDNSANYDGFQRVSAKDGDTTILTQGHWLEFGAHSGAYRCADDSAGPLDALGGPPTLPLGVMFRDENRMETAGFIRHLREVTPTIGKKGTTNGLNYIYQNDTTGDPGMAMSWDGVTAFP